MEQKILKSFVHCGAFTSLKGTSDFSPQAFFRKMPQHIPPPLVHNPKASNITYNTVGHRWICILRCGTQQIQFGAVDLRRFCLYWGCGPPRILYWGLWATANNYKLYFWHCAKSVTLSTVKQNHFKAAIE